MKGPTLKVTSDFTEEFNRTVKKFRRDAVLVGIPAEKTTRKDGETDTNAAILALNEFGSTDGTIPKRPVMAIGIRNAQEEISEEFKKAVQNAFKKGIAAISLYYNRAGIIASHSVKKAINSQEGIDAPAAATLAARKARGFKGTKALIVTGQMRNAITYVVKGEE